MTEHEKAAMEAAYDAWLRGGSPDNEDTFEAGWEAARAYEPLAVCGALRNANNVCALTEGHDGDHRAPLSLGGYFGWPREQEPDPHERCAYVLRIPSGIASIFVLCNTTRKDHGNHRSNHHAFVSAKEAKK